MRKLLLALAILLTLGSPGAQAAHVGASGYVLQFHAGNGCFAFLVTPNITSTADGVWFSIDTSSSAALTPQAAGSQVALIQGTLLLQSVASALAVTDIPQIGLDYDPSAPKVACLIDAVGDGQIQTIRATNFNFPKGTSQ